MNRLNLLFFALLISFIHNFYSEFNTIFLQSFLFLFFSELISINLFNRFRNQQNQTSHDDEDSSVSDISEVEDKTEKNNDKCEEKVEVEDITEKTTEEKTTEKTTEEQKKKVNSEETSEESDSDETVGSSDELVDITDGVDVSQMEILRLLNNYESLGDSGLMELKNKMLELDKLVEFYKNDTKKTKKE